MAIDHVRSEIVFSTRGSKNLPNWLANFDFIFVDSDLVDGGKAHQGFSNAWNEMSAGVLETIKAALASHPSYSVIVTGHSLGGAVATLGGAAIRAAGIPLDIYTYGSPRVGNDVLADFITAQAGGEYRVTRTNDPVPRLPPIFTGYRHTSPEYWLESYVEDGDDYPLVDVEVCEGNANVDCNAGQDGLDIDSHLYYFGPISTTSCDANSNSTAASSATVASTTSSSGKNTADQIKEYSAKDKQFVKST